MSTRCEAGENFEDWEKRREGFQAFCLDLSTLSSTSRHYLWFWRMSCGHLAAVEDEGTSDQVPNHSLELPLLRSPPSFLTLFRLSTVSLYLEMSRFPQDSPSRMPLPTTMSSKTSLSLLKEPFSWILHPQTSSLCMLGFFFSFNLNPALRTGFEVSKLI